MKRGDRVTWTSPTGDHLVGRVMALYGSGQARVGVLFALNEDGSRGKDFLGIETKVDQDDLTPHAKEEAL